LELQYPYYLNSGWALELKSHKCTLVLCDSPFATPHNHPDRFEIGYVLEGEIDHTIHGSCTRLFSGDYYFVDLGVTHSYTSRSQVKVLNCIFFADAIDPAFKHFATFSQIANSPVFLFSSSHLSLLNQPYFHDEDGVLLALLQQIHREIRQKKIGHHHMIQNLIQQIVIHLIRADSNTQEIPDQQPFFKDALQLIDECSGNISLQEIGKQLNYSADHIGRLFREKMHISFTEYIQRIKLSRSCTYLSDTDWSIAKVAETVGYQNVQFYHRLFKRYYSMTPLQYRKRRKK